MDLLTGKFLWQENVARPVLCSEPLPAFVEIVVVGGGISGAIIANALIEAGHQVIVLEKRQSLASGSTLASTAILQFELDTSLTELSEKIGAANARIVYKRSYNAWKKLCTLAEQFGDALEFSRRPSLCLASSRKDEQTLKLEAQALSNEGFDCEILSESDITNRYPFVAPAALFHTQAAQFDPVRFTQQLFARVLAQGGRIFNEVQVERLRCSNVGPVTLELADGRQLLAGRVVFATGYETVKFFNPESAKLFSSYAAATFPCKEAEVWQDKAVIWETARPYYYLRVATGPRIIIGGGDLPFRNPWMRDVLLPLKRLQLHRRLKELLPDSSLKFEYSWAGTFGESEDGMPFMGEVKSMPGVFLVIGCGGNGITFSMLAAELVQKWLVGVDDELTAIFSVER